MGYGIMRIEKRNKQALGGLEKEANREQGHEMNFPASDIDWERTGENVHLVQSDNWDKTIKGILEEHGIEKVRKDAVLMIDGLYTMSPEEMEKLNRDEQKEFFEKCLQFHEEHYGQVFNAVIHYDETTPHMQVASVPLCQKEDGTWKLSAKELCGNVKQYTERQDKFHEQICKEYGLERGKEQDRENRREHLDVLDYKTEQRTQELDRTEKELEQTIAKNQEELDWQEVFKQETEASLEYRDRTISETNQAIEEKKGELEEIEHHVQTQGDELSRLLMEQLEVQERTREEEEKEKKAREAREKEEKTRDYVKAEYQKQYEKVEELDKEIEEANKTLGEWREKKEKLLDGSELTEIKEHVREHRKTVEIPKEDWEQIQDHIEAQHHVEAYVREAESQNRQLEKELKEQKEIYYRSHEQGVKDMERISQLEKENKSLKEELSLVKESVTKFLQENKLVQAFRSFFDRFKHEKEQEKELAQDRDEPDLRIR